MAQRGDTVRRRRVPREWRDQHHRLSVSSHIAGGGWGGWGRVYRARGTCRCGAHWPIGVRVDNMTREEVIEAWKDHVEDAYYGEDG